jgi:hypothetical protein
MRKTAIAALGLLAFSAGATGTANATAVGAELFGGVSIPVVQDDNNTGPQYGLRVPITLPAIFTIEPYYARSQGGETKITLGGTEYTRSGFDVNTWGANLILGSAGKTPFSIFPYAGLNTNRFSRTGSANFNDVGFNVGLGLGIGIIEKLWIDARGEGNIVVTEDTSRKYVNVNVGVGYNFYVKP